MTDSLDFETWLAYGIDHHYVGPIVCATHDGIPMTVTEDEEFDEPWGEPCIPVIRIYSDVAEAKAVEANHTPSQWRWRPDAPAGHWTTHDGFSEDGSFE